MGSFDTRRGNCELHGANYIHEFIGFLLRFRDLQRKQESRAWKLLKSMAANASSALLRATAWLLLRLLRFPFDSVVYHEGQLQLVKEALQKEVRPVSSRLTDLTRQRLSLPVYRAFIVFVAFRSPSSFCRYTEATWTTYYCSSLWCYTKYPYLSSRLVR